MVFGYNVTRRTTCQSWSWVCRRLRQAHLVQHLRHLYLRKVQVQHQVQHHLKVRVQMSRHAATRRLTQPKIQNPIKMETMSMYGATRHIQKYVIGCKNLGKSRGASSLNEPSLEPLRQMVSGKHSVYTHFPKERNFEICLRTKITRASRRRRIGGVVPLAENFGDLITADHKIRSENCESRNNHRYAVVVHDLATQWIQAYPCQTKNFTGNSEKLAKVLGADQEA